MAKSDQYPLIKEVVINAPALKVWKAISDKDEMKNWYFDLTEFKAKPGFEFRFDGGPDDRIYHHVCVITEVVPGKKLSYSWRYEGYPGISYVTFELFEEGGQTKVRLTHESLETFPDISDFARHNFDAGWTQIIQKSLKEFVERN